MKLLPRLILILVLAATAEAGTLYSTEFESFPTGDNRWAGTEGWVSNDTTSGAQGVIEDPVADLPLGKAAFLGYATPHGRFTTVFRSVNHDPADSGLPKVGFETLLGVQDSTSNRRDKFHVSFYNIAGDFLAALTFDNTTGFLKRDDGTAVFATDIPFDRGDPLLSIAALQLLVVEIDLVNNRWSAQLDGVPVFIGSPFTATTKARTLGAVAAEWEVTAASAAEAGDNWLLVADWLVGALPREPFRILSTAHTEGATTLTWPGHAAFDYRVYHSEDLVNWTSGLPGSQFLEVANDGTLSFTDPSAPPTRRFYRVQRSLSR